MDRRTLASLIALTATFLAAPLSFAATPLSDVVTPGLLGKTLKYAEFKIGSPAMREVTDDLGIQRSTYELNGCIVSLGAQNNNVVSVGMLLNPAKGCDLDVNGIAQTPPGSKSKILASNTTFGDYAWRGPLHFTDPQVPLCNACGEGSFNATIDGIGVFGMLSIQLEGATYTRDSNYDEWRSILRSGGIDMTDDNALPVTSENCPLRRFDQQAFPLLKGTKVTGIAFSRTREVLQPQCNGKTVWPLIRRGG
jgi:hypothetical protein